jgi:hypothetical protein
MAQEHEDFALAVWRTKRQPKQKPPRFEILKGLLKAFATAVTWSFLLHQGAFTSNQLDLDPKPPTGISFSPQ